MIAGMILLLASPTGVTANDTPAAPEVCVMESSEVTGGQAVFTVGPENCNILLGPVSFSTYALPNGYAKPWSEQQLYSHSPDNGRFYGPGTYQIGASTGDLCNWQTDLYRGTGQDYAPHIHYLHGLNIGWDLHEGNVCDHVISAVPPPADPAPAPPVALSGVPVPAAAGFGVFDTRRDGSDVAASLRTPVIERTLSSSTAASSATGNWSSATVALGAAALALLLVGGILSQRRRFGSD